MQGKQFYRKNIASKDVVKVHGTYPLVLVDSFVVQKLRCVVSSLHRFTRFAASVQETQHSVMERPIHHRFIITLAAVADFQQKKAVLFSLRSSVSRNKEIFAVYPIVPLCWKGLELWDGQFPVSGVWFYWCQYVLESLVQPGNVGRCRVMVYLTVLSLGRYRSYGKHRICFCWKVCCLENRECWKAKLYLGWNCLVIESQA